MHSCSEDINAINSKRMDDKRRGKKKRRQREKCKEYTSE